MSYIVETLASAAQYFDTLPRYQRQEIVAALDQLSKNPRPLEARVLTEGEDLYVVYASRHRIAYRLWDETQTILVLRFSEGIFFPRAEIDAFLENVDMDQFPVDRLDLGAVSGLMMRELVRALNEVPIAGHRDSR